MGASYHFVDTLRGRFTAFYIGNGHGYVLRRLEYLVKESYVGYEHRGCQRRITHDEHPCITYYRDDNGRADHFTHRRGELAAARYSSKLVRIIAVDRIETFFGYRFSIV